MSARTLAELPAWAIELLATSPVGHLGLLDADGAPRVLPVTFAVAGGEVWSAIDDKPKRRHGDQVARVKWLRTRPQSALTVDRYDADWTRLAWVQVLGHTTVEDPSGHDDAMRALARKYPAYRDTPPAGPLLRLTPARALCWRAADTG
ncbi:MAG TPA: pyridoxamine 5'-phosphate oxidase family protein [Solirubrobacteraceae bacterium]